MDLPHRPGNSYHGVEVDGSGSHILGNVHNSVINNSTRPETPPTPLSTIIPRCDANFVDRQELNDRLHAHASQPYRWTALVGLGGAGKTQLAIKYVQSLRESDPNTWVLWLFASNPDRLEESLRDVAEHIKLPGRQEPKANKWPILENWLANSTRRWLIVLDNVDDADLLFAAPSVADETRALKQRINYVPSYKHGNVVITSRDKTQARRLVDESNLIEVLPMTPNHARILLQNKLGAKYDAGDATRLAVALDCMPLALSQAASFITQKRRYTIVKYLTELEKSRQSRTILLLQETTVLKRDRDASSSIILTWEISFSHIHSIRKSAADLLALMSFCDRQAIPDMLLRGLERQGDEGTTTTSSNEDDDYECDGDALAEDLQMLEDYSFISTATDSTTWDMHRLVQDATQRRLHISQKFDEAYEKYIEQLHAVVPTGEYENWKTCRILAPHVRSAVELMISPQKTSLLWATIMYKMAWYEMQRGSLTHAEEFVKASLCTRKGLLREDHVDTLCSKVVMSQILQQQGRWTQAEELEVEVLETRKTVLGAEHPNTLISMANLASTYWNQGRWKEAEELQVEVLETTKIVLGAGHPDTLRSMANLVATYFDQERLQEAMKLAQECAQLRVRVLGLMHPDTQNSKEWLDILEEHVQAADGGDP